MKNTRKKGDGDNIWDRIRSRREKGLPRLKPGQKGYPKTLDFSEDGPCWDTHKQVGMKKKNGKLVPNCVPKNESTYLRKSKKLPNLKVLVKRKPGNYTLADRIRGEKPKKLSTRIDREVIKDDMPANAAGHGGVAGIGVGPDGEPGVHMTRMTDKRRRKDKPPVLLKRFRTYESTECQDCSFDHVIMEAEYQGKKVKLNDPIRTSENPNKKFKVYTRGPNGNIVVVRFGDPNMSIKRDNPERRKSFRARHNCDNPGPKYKARYWSCYQWRAGAKVDN